MLTIFILILWCVIPMNIVYFWHYYFLTHTCIVQSLHLHHVFDSPCIFKIPQFIATWPCMYTVHVQRKCQLCNILLPFYWYKPSPKGLCFKCLKHFWISLLYLHRLYSKDYFVSTVCFQPLTDKVIYGVNSIFYMKEFFSIFFYAQKLLYILLCTKIYF